MKLVSTAALEGPNIWSRFPVWEARVDLSGWEEMPPTAVTEMALRLGEWLPSPIRDRRSGRICGGNAGYSRSRDCGCQGSVAWAAETLLAVVRTLHALSRRPLEFGCLSETCDPDVFLIAIECEEAVLARACFDFACELCRAAARADVVDVAGGLRRLRDLADDVCLGTTTGALVAAARQRGIPVRRLDSVSLVQLGHGAHQRRLLTAITDQTGKIAEAISLDKELTKTLLREIGVPVPDGRPVKNREDAWTAACELGLPVVVKPRNGDYGLGVSLNLRTRDEILAAYDEARRVRDEVMVEQFAVGAQHRATVVGQRLVAVVRRVSPQVTGDGVHTVAALIDQANQDPRRGDDEFTPLNRITPDEDTAAVLVEQGLCLDSVPAAGQAVPLSRLAHTWAGGGVEDVTDTMHPEVAAQCVRAARLIGLDVAGLDLIAQDLRQPLDAQGGVILEVNAGPAIALHFAPFCAHPRPVCEAILELLFPQGQTGRIPVVLICDDRAQSSTGRVLERLLRSTGRRIGRASRDGLHVAGVRLRTGPCANAEGARAVLLCPDVELAILEQSWDSIRTEGLAVDRCDVVVLAGPDRARSPDDERVARVLGEAVGLEGTLIVDAEAHKHLEIAAAHPGKQIVVTPAVEPPAPIAGIPAMPSRCVGRREGQFVLRSSGCEERLVAVDGLPLPRHLISAADQRELMRAVAAAWALGAVPDENDSRADSVHTLHEVCKHGPR